MILTDDDDNDDEGGRTRRPRRFPPFLVRCFQVDIPFNRVYEFFYLLGLVCPTNYILYNHGWAVSHYPAVIWTLRFPPRLPLPFSAHILSSHATSCFKYTSNVFLSEPQRLANTRFLTYVLSDPLFCISTNISSM